MKRVGERGRKWVRVNGWRFRSFDEETGELSYYVN